MHRGLAGAGAGGAVARSRLSTPAATCRNWPLSQCVSWELLYLYPATNTENVPTRLHFHAENPPNHATAPFPTIRRRATNDMRSLTALHAPKIVAECRKTQPEPKLPLTS